MAQRLLRSQLWALKEDVSPPPSGKSKTWYQKEFDALNVDLPEIDVGPVPSDSFKDDGGNSRRVKGGHSTKNKKDGTKKDARRKTPVTESAPVGDSRSAPEGDQGLGENPYNISAPVGKMLTKLRRALPGAQGPAPARGHVTVESQAPSDQAQFPFGGMILDRAELDTSRQAIDVLVSAPTPKRGKATSSASATLSSLGGDVQVPPRGVDFGAAGFRQVAGGTAVPNVPRLGEGPPASPPQLTSMERHWGFQGQVLGDQLPRQSPFAASFGGTLGHEFATLGTQGSFQPLADLGSGTFHPMDDADQLGSALSQDRGFEPSVDPDTSPTGMDYQEPQVPGPSGLTPSRGLLRLAGYGVGMKRPFTGLPSTPAPPTKLATLPDPGSGEFLSLVTQTVSSVLQSFGMVPGPGSAIPAGLPARGTQPAPPTGGQAAAAPMQQDPPPPPTPTHSRVAGEAGVREALHYKDLLDWGLPTIGLEGLMVAETLKGDSLDHLAGLPSAKSPWGLSLTEERAKQLQAALSPPALGRSLINGLSPFKVTPLAYQGAFKLPHLDPYLAAQQAAHSKAVPPSRVQPWVQAVGTLYETNMSQYRLAFHQSILTILLNSLVANGNRELAARVIPFLAHTEKEMMATAAAAAGHSLALMRQMVLAPLDYNPKTKATLAKMPYEGGALFGPTLQQVLQSEVDVAKQALHGEQLLREHAPSKPKAKASVLSWTAKPRTTPSAPSSKPPQGAGRPGKAKGSKPPPKPKGRGRRS